MEEELYKKDLYLTKRYYFQFNHPLIEYDMKEAGLNITKALHLLPKDIIKKVEELPKDARKKKLGWIQREDESYKKDLSDGFAYYRKRFFDENKLEFNEIHSIKKDAIFTTRYCDICQFDDFIEFRPKHKYTSYIYMNRVGEIYYAPNDYCIKGMQDEKVQEHDDGMNDIIKAICEKMETRGDEATLRYLRDIIDKYKSLQLPLNFYRRFDKMSKFDKLYPDLDQVISPDEVDISYNLFNVLIPLCKVAL